MARLAKAGSPAGLHLEQARDVTAQDKREILVVQELGVGQVPMRLLIGAVPEDVRKIAAPYKAFGAEPIQKLLDQRQELAIGILIAAAVTDRIGDLE